MSTRHGRRRQGDEESLWSRCMVPNTADETFGLCEKQNPCVSAFSPAGTSRGHRVLYKISPQYEGDLCRTRTTPDRRREVPHNRVRCSCAKKQVFPTAYFVLYEVHELVSTTVFRCNENDTVSHYWVDVDITLPHNEVSSYTNAALLW